MTKLSKSKWLLAGVLTGALALGSACKSNEGAERDTPADPADTTTGTGTDTTGTGTDTGTGTGTTTDPGTGGAGEGWDPGAAGESEPGVHHGDTGGSGTTNHQGGSQDTGNVGEGDTSGGTGGGGLDEGVIEEEDDVLIEDEPGTGGAGTTDTPDTMDSGSGGSGGSGMGDSLNEGGNNTTTPLPDDTGSNTQDTSNPDSIR